MIKVKNGEGEKPAPKKKPTAKERADAAENKAKEMANKSAKSTQNKEVAKTRVPAPSRPMNTETAKPVEAEAEQRIEATDEVFEIHPLAEAYPHMDEETYKATKSSILHNGQQEPVVVLRHPRSPNILQIIDGRHRYNISVELELPLSYKLYTGPDDEDSLRRFVEIKNAHRRDLTQAQRAMAAARLYTGRVGRPKSSHDDTNSEMTDARATEISDRSGISIATFRRAVRVQKHVDRFPEFVEQVFEGKVPLAPAHDMIADFEQTDAKLKTLKVTSEDFRKVAEAPSSINEVIRRAKLAEKTNKRKERDDKIADLAGALPEGEFQIVYADPPWKFVTHSENGMDRSAENHYPTMSLQKIKETKPEFADKAVLFLWTTIPFLAHAIDLITAWDLIYKSHFIWGKDKAGTGYWGRQNHEILLIATTEAGFPAPAEEDRMPTLQTFPRGKHSEKPEEYAEWIERCWPTAKKLEMYCRNPRDGWEVFGNEASGVSLQEQIDANENTPIETADDSDGSGEIDDAPVTGADDDDGFFDSRLSEPNDPLGLSERVEEDGVPI